MRPRWRQQVQQLKPGAAIGSMFQRQPPGKFDAARNARGRRHREIQTCEIGWILVYAGGNGPVAQDIMVEGEVIAAHLTQRQRPQKVRAGRGVTLQLQRVLSRQCRSEEHTSELQSLMRNQYAVFGSKNNTTTYAHRPTIL